METCSERKRWVINWSKPIDRDALLALADEMLSTSIEISSVDSIRPLEVAYLIQGYARRIREACGVEP